MLKYNNDKLICENKQIRQQTNNNENYSRRKNIVIRGIAEEDETNATCKEKVRRFMCEKLKLTDDTVSAMDIVRCHRMGGLDAKRRSTRHAQKHLMIVRFNSYKDKTTVWEKRFELTGNECSMSEIFLVTQSLIVRNCMQFSIWTTTRKGYFLIVISLWLMVRDTLWTT